jgi:hypothetical protein
VEEVGVGGSHMRKEGRKELDGDLGQVDLGRVG